MESNTVDEYKARERHKWNLSMAKNNAAVLCANDLAKMSPRQLESGEHMLLMKMTIRQLYETYNELDDELKDELPK